MIKTNLIRTIDCKGNIIIPKQLLNKINTKDYIGLFIKDNYFILKNTTKLNANVKIDNKNRIQLLVKVMDSLNIQPGYKMEFYTEGNNIIMKKYYKETTINDNQLFNMLEQIIA
jgi:bifunctional DNA-binding transcriptional regulator/antitoxin component of YhaV-PrlF toxin-antitoxin module